MNIFVLDTDPKVAASMHCDQHLHKMILESAQMLSTVAFMQLSTYLFTSGNYYKVTHANHPCTLWLQKHPDNVAWLINLCHELNDIRMSLGSDSHASMEIIEQFKADVPNWNWAILPPAQHIFCGPVHLQYNSSLTVPQKYQRFYKIKKTEWESAGRKMTWNGRAVPEFMNGEI